VLIFLSYSPLKLIRSPPPLHALADIGIALQLLDLLPHEIYLQLVRHPYDETIAYELGVEVSESEPEYGDEEDTDSAT
jgi:cell cycle arrest protein BUB2